MGQGFYIGTTCGADGGLLGLCMPQEPPEQHVHIADVSYPCKEHIGVTDNLDFSGSYTQNLGGPEEGEEYQEAPAAGNVNHLFVLSEPAAPSHLEPPTQVRNLETLSSDPGTAAVNAAGTAASAGGTAVPSRAALDLEFVLQDLQACEALIWGEAFDGLARGADVLQPDGNLLRSFLQVNTAILPREMDAEMLKAANNDTFGIDREGFIGLVTEHAIVMDDVLSSFMNLSSTDGDAISAEDCRAGVGALVQRKLSVTLNDHHSERIFDCVMYDAGREVNVEQWVECTQRVARTVRLLTYAGI